MTGVLLSAVIVLVVLAYCAGLVLLAVQGGELAYGHGRWEGLPLLGIAIVGFCVLGSAITDD